MARQVTAAEFDELRRREQEAGQEGFFTIVGEADERINAMIPEIAREEMARVAKEKKRTLYLLFALGFIVGGISAAVTVLYLL